MKTVCLQRSARQEFCFMILAVLCMVLSGCASIREGDSPVRVPEPAGDVTLVKPMQPTASADVGKRFLQVEDSPCVAEVRLAKDGRKFVYLPVNFTEGKNRRVAWDIKVNEDWSTAESVVFDFFAGTSQYVAGLNIYFHSVDGWYLSPFGIDSMGEWNRIEISRWDFIEEENPVGWNKIDTIRISTWRCMNLEQDGWFGLANFGVKKKAPGQSSILVVRGDTCGRQNKAERNSYGEYAQSVCSTLEATGIEATMVSDSDVKSYESLRGSKLVVLPYNTTVPPALLSALKSHVNHGGKIMACYVLPSEVAKLMGVVFQKNLRQHPRGNLSGFIAASKALPGQPAYAPQDSWASYLVDPGCGRVVATWAIGKGEDTGWPAIVQVRNGLYVGHVWTLSGLDPRKCALMEAIVRQYVPIDEVRRLRRKLEALDKQVLGGNRKTLAEVVKNSGSREATRSLAELADLRNRVEKLLNQGKWQEAEPLVSKVKTAIARTYFLTRQPKRGERRLVWCHDESGLPGWTWDRSIKHLAEGGFTDIIANMCWGGIAYYPSKVLPTNKSQEDRVRQCLDACRKYGIGCHVWKVCFNMDRRAPKAFQNKMVAEGRVQKNRHGAVNGAWLCPSNPLNQQMEIDAMVELAQNYPELQGIHFDYIRYSNNEVCFCDGCRKRFEAYIGRKLTAWPFSLEDKALERQWYEFRRSHISHVVKTVHDKVKAIRPKMSISAAVFPELNPWRDWIGQDWGHWCQEGWLDFICPMDYREDDMSFKAWIRLQQKDNHGVPIYPGIGISCWKDKNAYRLDRQIEVTREMGCPGFAVFNYDSWMIEPLKMLPWGTTRED